VSKLSQWGGWNRSRSREEGAPADCEWVVPCSILRASMVGWERLARTSIATNVIHFSVLSLVMTNRLVKWDREVIDTYVASCGIRGTLPWGTTELAALPPKKAVRNIVSEISAFIRTDGQTDRHMARSTRLVILIKNILLADESSIPFYSTSNGYNYNH